MPSLTFNGNDGGTFPATGGVAAVNALVYGLAGVVRKRGLVVVIIVVLVFLLGAAAVRRE